MTGRAAAMSATEVEIETVLDRDVRPGLSAHGGGIDLVAVADGRAELRLRGSCDFCYFRRSCVVNLVRPVLDDGVAEQLEYRVAGVGI